MPKLPSESAKDRSLGIILIVLSVTALLVAGFYFMRINFWVAPPAQKMSVAWADDIRLLEKSGKLPKQWAEIREVSIKADNSTIQEWLKELHPPIQRNPKGKFRLDVFLVFWIDGYRYGTVVQYHLVDLTNENTVWEDGRTFKLGAVY